MSADGLEIAKGTLGSVDVAPDQRRPLCVDISALDLNSEQELLITLSAVSKNESAFIDSGYECAWEQFNLTKYIAPAVEQTATLKPLSVEQSLNLFLFAGVLYSKL